MTAGVPFTGVQDDSPDVPDAVGCGERRSAELEHFDSRARRELDRALDRRSNWDLSGKTGIRDQVEHGRIQDSVLSINIETIRLPGNHPVVTSGYGTGFEGFRVARLAFSRSVPKRF